MDHIVKKQVFIARGAVSSANRFSVPARVDPRNCSLPQRYCFIQIAPDVSYHTDKTDNSFSNSQCVITLTLTCTNNQTVKI